MPQPPQPAPARGCAKPGGVREPSNYLGQRGSKISEALPRPPLNRVPKHRACSRARAPLLPSRPEGGWGKENAVTALGPFFQESAWACSTSVIRSAFLRHPQESKRRADQKGSSALPQPWHRTTSKMHPATRLSPQMPRSISALQQNVARSSSTSVRADTTWSQTPWAHSSSPAPEQQQNKDAKQEHHQHP